MVRIMAGKVADLGRQRCAPRALGIVFLLLLGAPAAAAPGGYGQYGWGESLAQVRKKAPKLRPAAPDRVEFEQRALKQIHEEAARAARAGGARAWRAFQRQKRPRPRLAAWWYWVELGQLAGRVELHFFDGRLYAAVVQVLHDARQQPGADRLLALVTEKYGSPTPPEDGTDPAAFRPKLTFDAGDGKLTLFRRPPAPKEKGLMRFVYQANDLGAQAEGYLEGLDAQLARATEAREARTRAAEEKQRDQRNAALLKHL